MKSQNSKTEDYKTKSDNLDLAIAKLQDMYHKLKTKYACTEARRTWLELKVKGLQKEIKRLRSEHKPEILVIPDETARFFAGEPGKKNVLLDQLKEYFASASPETIKRDWDKLKKYDAIEDATRRLKRDSDHIDDMVIHVRDEKQFDEIAKILDWFHKHWCNKERYITWSPYYSCDWIDHPTPNQGIYLTVKSGTWSEEKEKADTDENSIHVSGEEFIQMYS